jgi:uncharacterized protein YaaW (UPF0174 family)
MGLMTEYSSFVLSDTDLYDVLTKASEEALGMLVEILCKKMSCNIKQDCRDVLEVVNEFQRMGGATFANLIRGHGVKYREIVDDVARFMRVPSRWNISGRSRNPVARLFRQVWTRIMRRDIYSFSTISEMEWDIVAHLVQKAWTQMSEDQRRECAREIKREIGYDYDFSNVEEILKLAKSKAFQGKLRAIITRIVAASVLTAVGIRIGARIVVGRLGSLLGGPIGVIIGALLVGLDVQGPAYTVTVPGVLVVAMIRTRLEAERAAAEIRGD